MTLPFLPTWLVVAALVGPCLLYDLCERFDLVGWWRRRRARRAAEREVLDAAVALRFEVRTQGSARSQVLAVHELCDAVDRVERSGEPAR